MKKWFIYIGLALFVGCSNEFCSPQKTFESLIKAAREDNIEKFLDCLDLEFLKATILSHYPEMKIDDKRIKKATMTTPNMRDEIMKMMKVCKDCQFIILDEKDISANTKRLTIKIIPNVGRERDIRGGKEEWLFIKRGGKWKLNIEESLEV